MFVDLVWVDFYFRLLVLFSLLREFAWLLCVWVLWFCCGWLLCVVLCLLGLWVLAGCCWFAVFVIGYVLVVSVALRWVVGLWDLSFLFGFWRFGVWLIVDYFVCLC